MQVLTKVQCQQQCERWSPPHQHLAAPQQPNWRTCDHQLCSPLPLLPACTCCQALIKPRMHNTHVAQPTAEQLNLQHVGCRKVSSLKVSSCHCELCITAPKYQTSKRARQVWNQRQHVAVCIRHIIIILNINAATSSLVGVAAALMLSTAAPLSFSTKRDKKTLLWTQSEQHII